MATAVVNSAWTFDPELHIYRDGLGNMVPSVTQAMKSAGLLSFDGIPQHILEHKRQLGTLVHKIAELYDKGEDLNDFEIPAECLPYLQGYGNFRNDCGFEPELIEYRQMPEVNGMRYGMQLDRTGPIDGVRHIVELKCGASVHPAWGVQLAAYCVGIQPAHQRTSLPRVALQLGPQFTRNYKLHSYTDPSDFHMWMNALSSTIWKMNKNLFEIENIPERLEAA